MALSPCMDISCLDLVLQTRADPNQLLYTSRTPLMTACEHNQVQKVDILLRYGADPDLVDAKSSVTALWYAVHSGSLPCVKSLLCANVDMFLTSLSVSHQRHNTTTMQEALLQKNPHIITLLVEAGCSLLNTSEHLDKVKLNLRADIKELLEQFNNTPRPLATMAKFTIRKRLGHIGVDTKISQLPVPLYIRKFISYVGL